MSNRKLAKAIQSLSREVQRLYRKLNRTLVNWLLRSAFVTHNRRGYRPAGFILPAVTLLLLVVTLTVGAMTLRAFDRNTQVIANTQEKVIYNAATPAIDRARSKIEYLFDPGKDPRYPGGVPTEARLVGMLTNDGVTNGIARTTLEGASTDDNDPYTLPDESRVDIPGYNKNAWRYRIDTNGDNKPDATVLYSIVFKTPDVAAGQSAAAELLRMSAKEKAERGIVRNAPLSSQTKLTGCGTGNGASAGTLTKEAWFEDQGNTSSIRKNFQVDALVIPDDPKSATVTLEFQQDKKINRGNKYAAWFRSDLEIFPGATFNWNGAMHTEGSMMFGNKGQFTAYLVSSPESCLYPQFDASELSITKQTGGADSLGTFNGQAVVGMMGPRNTNDSRDGDAVIHIQSSDNAPPAGGDLVTITPTNDASTTTSVTTVASNPLTIVLDEKTNSVNPADQSNATTSNWAKPAFVPKLGKRFINKPEKLPYIDDLYRADNRYGPKPRYDNRPDGEVPNLVGETIPADNRLVKDIDANAQLTSEGADVGLDGYWERRARAEGLRILVGERLELGNIGGWETPRDVDGNGYITSAATRNNLPPGNPPAFIANGQNASELPGDPLYPPTVPPYPIPPGQKISHLTQQRRSLRDNLPAVQSAAIYHAAAGDSRDYPVACLAMTVHPGTPDTLRQSFNFFPTSFKSGQTNNNAYLLSDFFTGRGTDGWEYQPPAGTETAFRAAIANGQPLRIALDNLAHFAGEIDGAFPPKQDDKIHPYPALTMWGNYSNLRRALKRMDDTSYDALSVADKTYIQTAACTLGMLAKNIDTIQQFDETNLANDGNWNWSNANGHLLTELGQELVRLMDGDVKNGEVLPRAKLSTYDYKSSEKTAVLSKYNARDYDEVTPEMFIAALKQKAIQRNQDYLNSPLIRLAESIMLSHQIRRDRTFGFRPSPAWGEYVVPIEGKLHRFPTACDPDLFTLVNEPEINKNRYNLGAGRQEAPILASPVADRTAASWALKEPIPPVPPNAANPASFVGAVTGQGAAGFTDSLAGRRLALSKLCGALKSPTDGYGADETRIRGTGGVFEPKNRPTVQPMFPALYYLFPETAHGLKGQLEGTGATRDIADKGTLWDHRQPGTIANLATVDAAGLNRFDREPYVVDPYVTTTTAGYTFRPVSAAAPADGRLAAYPVPTASNPTIVASGSAIGSAAIFSRYPYVGSSPYPTADLPVSSIALRPRQIAGFPAGEQPAVLPATTTPTNDSSNANTNFIRVPVNSTPETISIYNQPLDNTQGASRNVAVPFLDRAMFDGRQLQLARVMDIDLGMLRSTKPAVQVARTKFGGNEPWLPISGIVYAFREDAVREDGIARPVGSSPVRPPDASGNGVTLAQINPNPTTGLAAAMDVTDPANPYDPALQRKGISIKSIDYLPDPDRRVHGFRLRNGAQLKRNPSIIGNVGEADNIRGLSLFTDQPVYIKGDFNLHQEGNGNETAKGALLEEFVQGQQLFPDGQTTPYNFDTFYRRRTNRDERFAVPDKDRWRPSEILADSISVLSSRECDGSIADTFVRAKRGDGVPTFNVDNNNGKIGDYGAAEVNDIYNSLGLTDSGCTASTQNTSFGNQNRPDKSPPLGAGGWEWKREGASFVVVGGNDEKDQRAWSDFTTPVQIGRTGEPLLIARPNGSGGSTPTPNNLPVEYSRVSGMSYRPPEGNRDLSAPNPFRLNSIVVSGIVPSRPGQSYGGLHNFPRMLEDWGANSGNSQFYFSGSFLQLFFSNYGTGPWDQEGWEPRESISLTGEKIPHYKPPKRLWGYDVALQLAPAGPAAARFAAPSSTRSEFYTEPPKSDPYIVKLCEAARGLSATAVPGKDQLNCAPQS